MRKDNLPCKIWGSVRLDCLPRPPPNRRYAMVASQQPAFCPWLQTHQWPGGRKQIRAQRVHIPCNFPVGLQAFSSSHLDSPGLSYTLCFDKWDLFDAIISGLVASSNTGPTRNNHFVEELGSFCVQHGDVPLLWLMEGNQNQNISKPITTEQICSRLFSPVWCVEPV